MDEMLEYILLGNAALIVAFACAWLFEKTAIIVNLRRAYRLRLHLAVAALCAASLPVLLAPIIPIFTSFSSVNGTDLLVAQYLKGNISLSAEQFSHALTAKNNAHETLLSGSSMLSQILLLTFAVAAILRAIYIGINIVKIRKHIKGATLFHSSRRVKIMYSPRTTIPFSTRGVFAYYILIPSDLRADPKALKIALGHEAQHIRQGDVDWEILLSLVSPLFTLNPAFWFLTDRIRRFREYTCDAAFLQKGGVAARDYCHLLVDIASEEASRRRGAKPATFAASVPFFSRDGFFRRSTKNTLRNRILALSQGATFVDGKMNKYINLLPAALLLLIVGAGVFMVAKPADWSHERLMLSTVVNLERLDRINGFGVPPLR